MKMSLISQLQARTNNDKQQLVFYYRCAPHYLPCQAKNPRVKYLLQAVDKISKCKRQSVGKNSKMSKFNIEAAQAIQDAIPKDIPLPNFDYLDAFLAQN